MKKIYTLLFTLLLILSMTACTKAEESSIMLDDIEMGSLDYQVADIMGVTYELFDNGYATIAYILHKEAELKEIVTYNGKDYKVIAIGYTRGIKNDRWEFMSVYKDYMFPQDNSPETLVLPKSIKYVGNSALAGCTAKYIEIPSQVTILVGDTFFNCINLETLDFPDSLEIFSADGMFFNCNNLKSIELPSGCENLDLHTQHNAFVDCFSLESVVIPGSLKILDNMVFWNCNELTDVTICEGIETIGYHIFGNCPKLTTLVFPESVTVIKGQTFANCPNLKDVTLPDGIHDVPANMFLNEYGQTLDGANITIRVKESMVSYVQSIYPAANVVAK